MTPVTHVFFDLHGVLVKTDHPDRRPYTEARSRYLSGRFGGDPADWTEAQRLVAADWDSYYVDLDLDGDDSLTHMWEGETRTLRALFRLTGRPYPPPDELRRLVREQLYDVTSQIDLFYPDAHHALQALAGQPFTFGVISHGATPYAQGLLVGAGVREQFAGPIITPTEVGYFGKKDEGYFRLGFAQAGVAPQACLVVDDRPVCLEEAAALGAHVVLIDRADRFPAWPGWRLPDLVGLPDLLSRLPAKL